MVKNLPATWETGFNPWVGKIPLEEDMATHSSVLAWRIRMDRGTWRATVHEVAKGQTQLRAKQNHFVLMLLNKSSSRF